MPHLGCFIIHINNNNMLFNLNKENNNNKRLYCLPASNSASNITISTYNLIY